MKAASRKMAHRRERGVGDVATGPAGTGGEEERNGEVY